MKSQSCRLVLLLVFGVFSYSSLAQDTDTYQVPRTQFGQPDFQGNWHTKFVTMLERPDSVENLVVPREEALAIAAAINSEIPHNEDPDFEWQSLVDLALVRGEYRTSIIVDPANGKLPYRETAMPIVEFNIARYLEEFDHPEQRPLGERCLQTFAGPPIHAIPLMFPYQIIQTENHFVLYAEGSVGLRLVQLNSGREKQDIALTHVGHSTGYWEGETLVIKTTNFREDHPSRTGFGRPLLVGSGTTITERFTRLSENELNYYFTVEDEEFYAQPFSGEFSLFTHEGPLYEYGCHEGNYSLPSILRGGQMQKSAAP